MSITGLPGETSWQVSFVLTTLYLGYWFLRAKGTCDWISGFRRLHTTSRELCLLQE